MRPQRNSFRSVRPKATGRSCVTTAAQEVVAEAVTQVAGPLRITAPLSFGTQHLAPALAEFAKAHPRIEIDVSLNDRTVDLIGGGYDMAVRIGNLADSSLVARRIKASAWSTSKDCRRSTASSSAIVTSTTLTSGHCPRWTAMRSSSIQPARP